MSLSLTLPWTRVCRISPSPRRNDNATLTMSSSSITNNKCNSNENVDRDDSAFIEPEYSNTSGSNPASYHSYTNRSSGSNERISCEDEEGTHHAKPYRQEDYEEDDDGDYSSPCPDYEEVDPVQVQRLRDALNLSSPRVRSEVAKKKRTSIVTNGGLVYNLASEGIFSPTKKNAEFNFIATNPNTNYFHLSNSHHQNQQAFIEAATAASSKSDDPATKEKIMKSSIFCIHKDEGCNWQGQLSKLKAHLNVCQKDAVGCLNQCGAKIARVTMEDHMLYTCSKRLVTCSYCRQDFTGAVIDEHTVKCGFEPVYCEAKCGQKIQRNRIRAHMVNTCSKRMVGCAYCAKSYTADTLQSHHGQCRRFPVSCPNKCRLPNNSEFISIPREELEKHLNEDCSARMIITPTQIEVLKQCTYKEAGCDWKGSDLDTHLQNNSQFHLDLMCSLAHKQEANIRRLVVQLDRAQTSYNGVLIWKIKDVSLKMAEAKSQNGCLELISPSFYTSAQCGYRLQASLFLNGNGAGENSHLSVYIKLLPGEFDGILRWPFKHTVSFTLLDQTPERKDAVNVVESFLPDPSWPNFQRPSKQPDQLGFGFPKFVPHELLTARNYIREDSLFIKIRVDPSRNIAV